MSDSIQRALDGELPADQLTPEDRAELHEYRAAIRTALGPIRQLPAIDVVTEVMRGVTPAPGPLRRAAGAVIAWLWSPRPISLAVRPAYALAGAVAAVAAIYVSASQSAPAGEPGLARVVVQFRLGAAEAREVALVGDFNGWRPEHRLHQITPGVWSVDVALEPGVYNYVFMVDGDTWRLDPLAPRVTDGFGGASSRVAVLAPDVRS